MPFREAHHVVGKLVELAEGKGCALAELPLADMQGVERRITTGVYKFLSVDASVASRKTFGGTSPRNVRREANRWLKHLAQEGRDK
jgi:argininosuccinate lyase